MIERSCPYEAAVAEAARSGSWTPELEAHRNGCMDCAELTLVVAALSSDAENLARIHTPLPEPDAIWLRARLASRERDYQRATRAIVWIQRAALAVSLAIGAAFLPGLWRMVKGTLSGFDLASPLAELPRAAGSPILIVIVSLMVVAALAFMEFASLSEG